MNKKLRNTIIISASSLIVLTAGFLIFYPVPAPPVIKMKTARDSLSLAAKNQADRYSPARIRNVYHKLLETDVSIKTGKVEGELALDVLIAELGQRGAVSA